MMVKPWHIASFILIFVFILQLFLSHRLLSALHNYLFDDPFIQFDDYTEGPSPFINPNSIADFHRRLSQDPLHTHSLPNPAILLFCYNRPGYLNQTLQSLSHLQGLDKFHVIISQDGTDQPTADAIQHAAQRIFVLGSNVKSFQHWQHPRIIPSHLSQQQQEQEQPGHAWLAQHYKWALSRLFSNQQQTYSHVIILEDDMLFSPDFLFYFQTTAPLLDVDPTLWCISSWNDNGFSDINHQWDNTHLFRTSYFPGLGWMMKRELWVDELSSTWPDDHWDHFMRYETTSKGRGCIVPEVNRNKNIGEEGSNMDKYSFKRLIAKMNWHDDGLDGSDSNSNSGTVFKCHLDGDTTTTATTTTTSDHGHESSLSSLLEPGYSERMKFLLEKSSRLEIQNIYATFKHANASISTTTNNKHYYLILYTIEEYGRLSSRLKLWGGIPRGHHRHLTYVPYKGAILLLADKRFCPLLSSRDREMPGKGLTAVVSEPGTHCDDACANAHHHSTSSSSSNALGGSNNYNYNYYNWRGRFKSSQQDHQKQQHYKCSTRDFWFINTCSEMKRHFACEGGCNVDLNLYVPAYVMTTSSSSNNGDNGNGAAFGEHSEGMCLITHKTSRCNAMADAGKQRLCPCIPIAVDDDAVGKRQGSSGSGGLTTEERLERISEKVRRVSELTKKNVER